MSLQAWMRSLLCTFGLVVAGGCADQQQQQQMEEAVEQEDGENADLESEGNLDENGDPIAGGADGENNLGLNDLSDLSNLATAVNNSGNMGGNNYAGQNAAGNYAMPTGEATERVVRYVLGNDTPVYDQPSNEATVVAQLHQGTPIVVQLRGDWAEITPSRFIASSAISAKGVGRDRNFNDWQTGTP